MNNHIILIDRAEEYFALSHNGAFPSKSTTPARQPANPFDENLLRDTICISEWRINCRQFCSLFSKDNRRRIPSSLPLPRTTMWKTISVLRDLDAIIAKGTARDITSRKTRHYILNCGYLSFCVYGDWSNAKQIAGCVMDMGRSGHCCFGELTWHDMQACTVKRTPQALSFPRKIQSWYHLSMHLLVLLVAKILPPC